MTPIENEVDDSVVYEVVPDDLGDLGDLVVDESI